MPNLYKATVPLSASTIRFPERPEYALAQLMTARERADGWREELNAESLSSSLTDGKGPECARIFSWQGGSRQTVGEGGERACGGVACVRAAAPRSPHGGCGGKWCAGGCTPSRATRRARC